ncbi:DUF4860 domain-containing protein [Butyrivibrio sp. MC2013]|uniref:DUF4860 domain-containing protein n=1 Tax=Butyrivibrio sp. MC2013 TaxID=1280686 RepID=UPI000404FD60|nr:DUF4860 domain-containing protein [Butyrivibrio sp. MC2013]
MTQQLSRDKHIIETITLTALLFGFALCSVMVIALGSSVYKRTLSASDSSYEIRTAGSYVLNKIRCASSSDMIRIGKVGNSPAIKIYEELNKETYVTSLYVYDGSLMEIMSSEKATISPMTGQRIMDMDSMDISMVDNSLCRIEMAMTDKSTIRVYVALRNNAE